jgi:hypothetical protein
MKRMSIFLALLIFVIPASAIDEAPLPEPTQRPDATYRLFRTQNIYTQLKLDTRTGQIWQVQWGADDEHRFALPINRALLLPVGTTEHPTVMKPGRFTLSPTENIYTFMLLDQEDGRTWQVQWGRNDKERFIIAIP